MIKKNEPAKYDGVLMPELNYRNYKELELEDPTKVKMIQAECIESGKTEWYESPLLWVAIGFLGGVVVVHK